MMAECLLMYRLNKIAREPSHRRSEGESIELRLIDAINTGLGGRR